MKIGYYMGDQMLSFLFEEKMQLIMLTYDSLDVTNNFSECLLVKCTLDFNVNFLFLFAYNVKYFSSVGQVKSV